MSRIATFFVLVWLLACSQVIAVNPPQLTPDQLPNALFSEQDDNQIDATTPDTQEAQAADDRDPQDDDAQDSFTNLLEELAQKLESNDPIEILQQFNTNKEILAKQYTPAEVAYLGSVINLAIDSALFNMQRMAFQYAAQSNLKKARTMTSTLEALAKRLAPIDSVRAAYATSINKNIECAIALNAQ